MSTRADAAIGIYGIEDVRPTLKAYEGTHIPTEHGRREKEIKDAQVAEWEARRGKLGAGGLFGSLGVSALQSYCSSPTTGY